MFGIMDKRKELTTIEYRRVLIDILNEFDGFCRVHNLRYYLIGGTLIGAIRHKGFIPWDDDVDVGMPQEDYEKFRELYANNNSFYFIDCFTDKNYYIPFGKLCSNKVDLHENINSNLHIGAYVDIFPFNFIKDINSKKLEKALNRESFCSKFLNLKYASSKNKNFIKKLAINLVHILYPLSLNRISRNQIKKYKQFVSEKPTPYFGCLYRRGMGDISYWDNFSKTIEVTFEGNKYLAPVGYDNYLTRAYGDYIQFPPKEQQIAHHSFSAYWKEKE